MTDRQFLRLSDGWALAAALYYANIGWPVIPLRDGTKAPATPRGWKDGTTDESAIRRWFSGQPDRGIGICIGLLGDIWVLDVDTKTDGVRTLAQLELDNGLLPDTPTVETGTYGLHLYFRGQPPNRRTGALRGLDVVTGYSIAPPTVNATTGRRYIWTEPPSTGIAPPPSWLVAALSLPKKQPPALPQSASPPVESSRYLRAAVSGIADDLGQAGEGSRQMCLNNSAFRLGQLARDHGGLSVEDAVMALTPALRANGLALDGGIAAHVATIQRAFNDGLRGAA